MKDHARRQHTDEGITTAEYAVGTVNDVTRG